jgi:transglutaminase-like putative cysteine protease
MSRRARELETIALTMLAALPLYATHAISPLVVVVFHAVMLAIGIRVAFGRSPQLVPLPVLNASAVAYFIFFFVDWVAISHNLIAASSHLVLFIAAYQPMEAMRVRNQGQRLLITALIFVASIATATHISIVLFVFIFAWLMFRQLMYLSHLATVQALDRPFAEPASGRAAIFYVAGTAVVATLLFPIIPRIRNPLVHGVTSELSNATTGLSESINFDQQRASASGDAQVMARVWMEQEAIPLFTPLRMRAVVYDRFGGNRWQQTPHGGYRSVPTKGGVSIIARPTGFSRSATIQQRFSAGSGRLLLPAETYKVTGLQGAVLEGPTDDAYATLPGNRDKLTYDVGLSPHILPLPQKNKRPPAVVNYPVRPEVAALARRIVGDSTAPSAQARKIAAYMEQRFRYVADPALMNGQVMTVDDFLLREHRGHCEYFAAGMVALMTSLGVPARIVGGFYGGELNPLTGYFVIRKQHGHAWVEVWDGTRWLTEDPTPASLRPGSSSSGLFRAYAGALAESINYFWDRYVLTFGLGDQVALAIELITRGRTTLQLARTRLGESLHEVASLRYLMVLAALLLAGLGAIAIQRRRRPIHHQLLAAMARLGIEVSPAMTMEEALTQVRVERPAAAAMLSPLVAMYEEEQFSERPSKERRAMLKRGLAQIEG